MFLFLSGTLFAQDILTAPEFFDSVSERYGEIDDYVADIRIEREESEMEGTLYYRSPNLLRIDFTVPEEQVLVADGENLTVYVPRFNVVLEQRLRQRGTEAMASMAGEEGLSLLRSNYSIAYLEDPDPVRLDEESQELVTKLRLTWRSTNEGFRQLTLSISDDLLIRRIEGTTVNYDELRFDFEDIRINQSIPARRFDYDAPASANTYSNFLFDPDA
ncbi:MAG: LolA family protein [Spirochaetaceae bacterium]